MKGGIIESHPSSFSRAMASLVTKGVVINPMATTPTTNWASIQKRSIDMGAPVHSMVHNKLLTAFGAGSTWVIRGFDLRLVPEGNTLYGEIDRGMAVHDTTVIDMMEKIDPANHMYIKIFDTTTTLAPGSVWYIGVRYWHGILGIGVDMNPTYGQFEAIPSTGDLQNFYIYYVLILDTAYPSGSIDVSHIKVIDRRFDRIPLYEHMRRIMRDVNITKPNHSSGTGGFYFYRGTAGYTDLGYKLPANVLRVNPDRSFIIEDGTTNEFHDPTLVDGLKYWGSMYINNDAVFNMLSPGHSFPTTVDDIVLNDLQDIRDLIDSETESTLMADAGTATIVPTANVPDPNDSSKMYAASTPVCQIVYPTATIATNRAFFIHTRDLTSRRFNLDSYTYTARITISSNVAGTLYMCAARSTTPQSPVKTVSVAVPASSTFQTYTLTLTTDINAAATGDYRVLPYVAFQTTATTSAVTVKWTFAQIERGSNSGRWALGQTTLIPRLQREQVQLYNTKFGKTLRVSGNGSHLYDLVNARPGTQSYKAGDLMCLSLKYKIVQQSTPGQTHFFYFGHPATSKRGMTIPESPSSNWSTGTQLAYPGAKVVDADGWKYFRAYYRLPRDVTYGFNTAASDAVLWGIYGIPTGTIIDFAQMSLEHISTSWKDPDNWMPMAFGAGPTPPITSLDKMQSVSWDARRDALVFNGPGKYVFKPLIEVNAADEYFMSCIVANIHAATPTTVARSYIGFIEYNENYQPLPLRGSSLPTGMVENDIGKMHVMFHHPSNVTTEGQFGNTAPIIGTSSASNDSYKFDTSTKYIRLCVLSSGPDTHLGATGTFPPHRISLTNLQFDVQQRDKLTSMIHRQHIIPDGSSIRRWSTFTADNRARDFMVAPIPALSPSRGQISCMFRNTDSVLYSNKRGFIWHITTDLGFYGLRYGSDHPTEASNRSLEFIINRGDKEQVLRASISDTSPQTLTVICKWDVLNGVSLWVNGIKSASATSFTTGAASMFTSMLAIGSTAGKTQYADARFYNIKVRVVPETDAETDACTTNQTTFNVDMHTILLIPTHQGQFVYINTNHGDDGIDDDNEGDEERRQLIHKQLDTLRAVSNRECLMTKGSVMFATLPGPENYVKWSTTEPLELIAFGKSDALTTSGTFTINMPVGETIIGVGGALSRNVVTNGILINNGEALYYILPLETNGDYKPGHFRIVGSQKDYTIGTEWVLIAAVTPV